MTILSVSKKSISADFMKYSVLIFCVFCTLIRLWLTRGQPLLAISSSVHDDKLFLTLASHIANGNWLGPYNSLTLIKGPFFPIWAAAINQLGFPLLLSEQIFYAFACFILSISLQPVIKNKRYIAILYILLLFNPASFDAEFTRPSRDFLYTSLTLLVISCTIGLLISQIEGKSTRHWALGLGISFGCFWLTREEGHWLLPFILMLCLASIFSYTQRNSWKIEKKILLLLRPWLSSIVIFLLLLNLINYINFRNYGVFAKTEFDAHNTQAAWGALTRVKPSEVKKYVPVTKDTLREIYEVSPAVAELADYFEGYMGEVFWPEQANSLGRDSSNRTEILGGFFPWAFRDAMSVAGYYSNGKYPEDYYVRVTEEINVACESGKLDCYGERTTLLPVLHLYYLKYLLPYSIDRIIELVKFDSVSVHAAISRISDEDFAFFTTLTNEKIYINTESRSEHLYSAKDQINVFRVAILEAILNVYRFLFPAFFILSILGFIFMLIWWIRKSHGFIQTIISFSLSLSIIARSILLSLFDIATLDIKVGTYLLPLYPVMTLFIVLTVIEGGQYFLSPSTAQHNKSTTERLGK